jgi:hypothetical protein
MLDQQLVGVWSADACYGPGAQSDDVLVFKADGTGRFDFINFTLCSADKFIWSIVGPGKLSISPTERLQPNDDCTAIEPCNSTFSFPSVPYQIAVEPTPSGRLAMVLRIVLSPEIANHFAKVRDNVTGMEEPEFVLP